MKRTLLLLLVIVVSIFGMQQLKDVKEQLRMLRAAGVSEDELAELKLQEAALEAQTASRMSQEFETVFRQWKQIVPTNETQLMEKQGLAQQLLIELAQKSGSRWFYTGDLINRVLEIQETPVENQPPFGLTIQVPEAIRRELSNPLVYLVSFQQFENTCGFHSLANAYAVTKQVNDKRPITYEATRAIAEEIFRSRIENDPDFRKLICPTTFNEPEYSDLLSVMRTLGFRSHFVVDPNFFIIDETNINDRSVMSIQARAIKQNAVTNFMYRTRDHFFVISVVKYRTGDYRMFLLDSLNSPLRVDSNKAKFIAHIDNLIQMAKGMSAPQAAVQSQPSGQPQGTLPSPVSETRRRQEELDVQIARRLAQEESVSQSSSSSSSTSTRKSQTASTKQEWQRLQEERKAAHKAKQEAERQATQQARQTVQESEAQPQRPVVQPAAPAAASRDAQIAEYEAQRRAEFENLLGEDLP